MGDGKIDGFTSALDMLQALRDKRISAVELLDLHLDRIKKFNPTVNAIVTPDYDNARKAAAHADEARARGEDGVVLGLPLTIKDCIDVEGLLSTAGLEELADHRSEADSPIVARLRAAGAVIMGKTNLPPNALDWQSNNPLFGRTRNPWNLERSPGGSTGGGAAALAAGLTPLEYGSDLGGSIRIPAAFCGVYGHKPSETAIPRSGGYPGSELPNPTAVMSVQGPLARSAGDLRLGFDVVAGPEVGEDVAWRLEIPPARHERLVDYRVAVLPAIPWLPVQSEITDALEGLADNLRQTGAKVAEAQPDFFGDFHDAYRLYCYISRAASSVGSTAEERRQTIEETLASGDPFAEALARGYDATASDFVGWLHEREVCRRSFDDFFQHWDVLLAPSNVVTAFPHTDAPRPERLLDINGRTEPYGIQRTYAAVATLTGQPSTAFPAGFSSEGLPIGLQAVGPYLEDRTPMRFAELVAEEFGGFQPPPGYD